MTNWLCEINFPAILLRDIIKPMWTEKGRGFPKMSARGWVFGISGYWIKPAVLKTLFCKVPEKLNQ